MVAFCPSLDISTSGKDFNDAVKNFYERFQLYIETCMEMGTLWKDLMAHGWKVTETRITPPSDVNLLRTKEVNRILRSPKYEKMSASVRIPAM